MAGIGITLGGDFSALDKLKAKVAETAKSVQSGFSERIGHRMLDGILATAQRLPELIGKAVKASADNETAEVTFANLIGNAEKAKKVVGDLREFAAATPFEMPELSSATQKLLAFGESSDTVMETLRRVGDVSAGVQAPIAEIADIYGKARVAGTLFSEDINQLTGRGIPVLDEFAKILGVGVSEVKKMASEGKVTFPMLEQAFGNLTGKGGKFAGMMESQSKTLNGLLSSVSDNVSQAGAQFADGLTPAIKEAAAITSQLLGDGSFKQWGQDIAEVTGRFMELARTIPLVDAAMIRANDVRGQMLQEQLSKAPADFALDQVSNKVTSREDIAGVLEEIQKRRQELAAATNRFTASLGVGPEADEARGIAKQSFYDTDKILLRRAEKIRQISDEQLAANKATKDAADAEKNHADEVARATKEYEKLSKAVETQLGKSQEKANSRLPLEDQIKAAREELKAITSEFSDNGFTWEAVGGEGAASAIGNDTDSVRRSKDAAVLVRAMEASDKLLELEKKKADEQGKSQTARDEALASENEEMAILRAQIAGNQEKVEQLNREAAMRRKIAELVKLGVPPAAAEARGRAWAEASEKADRLADLRSKMDGLKVGTSISAVDSMQRIGGGGGVAANGLDYARKANDYQRQMVAILASMHGKMPSVIDRG